MLADSGFGSTLIRAVSYFKAGAAKIPRTRKEYDEVVEIEKDEPHLENLKNLLSTSFRIYLYLNLFVLLILLTAGVVLVWNIMELGGHDTMLWLAYALIIPYCLVMITAIKWSSFVRGLGYISLEARISTMIDAFQVVIFVLILTLKLPPAYLVGMMLISVSFKLLWLRRFVLKWFRERGIVNIEKRHFDKNIFHSLWGATWRNAGLSWGNYAIIYGTSIVVAQIKDPVMMASFLMTMRVIDIISGIARAPFYANIPKIYEFAAKKDFVNLKKRASEYIFVGMAMMVGGFAVMALLGNWTFGVFGIDTRFLPLAILLVIFATEVLNWHSAFHASIYISTNQVPFLIPSTVSGGLIIGLGLLVLPRYGVMGLVLTQFFIQLAFNNWFAVWLSLGLLKWNFFNYLRMMPVYGVRGVIDKAKYFLNR